MTESVLESVLEVSQLTKIYKKQRALDSFDLSVSRGEIVGIIGPNGAGKSTLLRSIVGLTPASEKNIQLFGSVDYEALLTNRHFVGALIEAPAFVDNMSAKENMIHYALQRKVKDRSARINEVLALVGLDKTGNKKVKNFSLGMKQRLALAFALVKKPQILLLDEPTNGLDPAGIHEIRELIVKLAKEEGLTVFISSHILSEIEQIADRVGIINHGCLVYEGEIREIKSNTWIGIGGDFSQNNIVQHLVDFCSVKVREASASEVKLDDMSNDRLADIITYITDLGFRIFRVTRESETLEDIFLELTKEV